MGYSMMGFSYGIKLLILLYLFDHLTMPWFFNNAFYNWEYFLTVL